MLLILNVESLIWQLLCNKTLLNNNVAMIALEVTVKYKGCLSSFIEWIKWKPDNFSGHSSNWIIIVYYRFLFYFIKADFFPSH